MANPKLEVIPSVKRKYHFEDFVPCPCCDRLDIKFCKFCGRVGFRGEVEFEATIPSEDIVWNREKDMSPPRTAPTSKELLLRAEGEHP